MSSKTKPLKHLQQQVQKQGGALTSRQQRLEVRQFSGPVPDPETLRGYEELVPGSAKEIVKAFTKGMAVHRFRGRMEPITDLVAMLFAFSLVIAAGWVGYDLIMADKDLPGWTALVTALAIILVAFWKRK